MMRPPNVILLSIDEPENAALQRILSEHAIVTPVSGLTELSSVVEHDNCDAVFCGWSFQDGSLKAAMDRFRERCPDLPVIIFSRTGGEQEWVDVLEAGAFDLLASPYRKDTVIPVLEHAVASRQARRLHSGAIAEQILAV